MSILDDPDMKEVVDEFCQESKVLLKELEGILDNLEDEPENAALLEEFGQKIDRIMGSAATLGADEIATFCELGKTIGYKSSQHPDQKVRDITVAILFDAVDLLKKMFSSIENKDSKDLKELNTDAFVSRLKWLSEKFKDIDRSSCDYTAGENEDQVDIDNLLESLGL